MLTKPLWSACAEAHQLGEQLIAQGHPVEIFDTSTENGKVLAYAALAWLELYRDDIILPYIVSYGEGFTPDRRIFEGEVPALSEIIKEFNDEEASKERT